MLSAIARYHNILLDGNKANLIALVSFHPLTGMPSAELIDVVAYRELTRFRASDQILVILRELFVRLAQIGVVVTAVISDEGKESNPSRPRIQALQAGLTSMSSACHDVASILVAIGGHHVIIYDRIHNVNLADINLRLDPLLNPLDPEALIILQRFWAHLKTI